MTMHFGVLLPQAWNNDLVELTDPVEAYETMTHIARTADEAGFSSVWLIDHFQTIPRPSQEVAFEAWIAPAARARDTRRVRVGQLVTCTGYRNPALLAKMASTVDVLSHGRLNFGIGAGWHEQEYRAYGYEYPDAPARLRSLREALQVILAMWTQEEAVFEGISHQVHGAINQPKGVQQPHIPILIGAGVRRSPSNWSHSMVMPVMCAAIWQLLGTSLMCSNSTVRLLDARMRAFIAPQPRTVLSPIPMSRHKPRFLICSESA